jgi:hypothetical protein
MVGTFINRKGHIPNISYASLPRNVARKKEKHSLCDLLSGSSWLKLSAYLAVCVWIAMIILGDRSGVRSISAMNNPMK